MALSTAKSRNALSLKKKVEVLTTAEKNPRLGVRRLAKLFSCGRTQIGFILKNNLSCMKLMYHEIASAPGRECNRVC